MNLNSTSFLCNDCYIKQANIAYEIKIEIKRHTVFFDVSTGLKGNKSVEVTQEDHEGPLSSVPTEEVDYLLWLSWIVVLGFTVHMASNTATARSLWQFLASFGQEHNHQHID